MTEMKRLTIVVPVFNERETIGPFFAAMRPVVEEIRGLGVEPDLLFVDDGSSDGTAAAIMATETAVPVTVLALSRNFGKEAAMTAGLAEAKGDAVAIIDVDLQDPPALIAEMVRRWLAGALVVLPRRVDRSEDSLAKRVTADWFYRLHNRISSVRIPSNVGDFRLVDADVVAAINSLPENRRFMKGIFAWVGFQPVFIDYRREKRVSGKSKFSGWQLWRFAVEGITSFSEIPLVIWTYVGGLISFSSILYALFIVTRTLIFGRSVPGYASLLTGILFLGGVQILGIGLLGEYVGRIYSEVKRRPPYVIASRQRKPGASKPGTSKSGQDAPK